MEERNNEMEIEEQLICNTCTCTSYNNGKVKINGKEE